MVNFSLIPQPTDQRNTSQGDILNDFTYLQAMVGTDHNFTNTNPNTQDGYHTLVHLVPQASPANDASNGQVYSKTGTTGNALHFTPSTGPEVQLSLMPIRAVVNFNNTGGVNAPSFNVTSVTNPSLGNYTINFTTNIPSANFVPTLSIMPNGTTDKMKIQVLTNAVYGSSVAIGSLKVQVIDETTGLNSNAFTAAFVSVIGG